MECFETIMHTPVLPLQGPRYSMPYFLNPKLNYVIQGPKKRWGPVTGFDMLSKTGKCLRRQIVSGATGAEHLSTSCGVAQLLSIH